jgi:ABC-2 type transport system permease protein
VIDVTLTPARRPSPIRRYVSIARMALQQALAYRGTAIFTVLILFLWIAILFSFWSSAYAGRDEIAGFTHREMRTYILLAYAINALVGWRVGSGMMGRIRTGEIVIDMVRPLNYRTTQLASATGFAVVEGVVSFGIAVGLGLLFFDIRPPDGPLTAAIFLLSVLMGFVTKVLVIFLISLLTFWTLQGVGLMWAQQSVIAILSGTLVPLALLPAWIRLVAEVLPLRGIVATPVSIYLGSAEGAEMLGLLALQAGWLAALWWVTDKAWLRAFRAVEIQGG